MITKIILITFIVTFIYSKGVVYLVQSGHLELNKFIMGTLVFFGVVRLAAIITLLYHLIVFIWGF